MKKNANIYNKSSNTDRSISERVSKEEIERRITRFRRALEIGEDITKVDSEQCEIENPYRVQGLVYIMEDKEVPQDLKEKIKQFDKENNIKVDMMQTLLKDNIKKPSKPHRVVYSSDIQTKEDIEKRKEQIKKLEVLDIKVNMLDGEKEYEEDIDKLEASLLIMQDRELPKELENRLLKKKEEKNRSEQNKKQ